MCHPRQSRYDHSFFFTTCQFQLRAGDGIEIYVHDEDSLDHDIMFICTGTIITDTPSDQGGYDVIQPREHSPLIYSQEVNSAPQ